METKQKKSILYIIPRFHPFKGGAEQNFLSFAERMVQNGFDVTVYTSNFKFRDEKLSNYEEYKGIKIHRFKSYIKRPYYLIFMPGLFFKVLLDNYDLIHVSGFGFLWIEFCLSLRKLIKPHTVLIDTPHGPFMAQGDTKGLRGFSRRTYTKILKLILPKLYSKVIAVVPKQTEWLNDLYGLDDSRVEVIPNGIESSYIESTVPNYSKNEKVIITYLNRMEWYKGIQDVLSAIVLLKNEKDLPNFEFWIMGRPAKFTEVLRNIVKTNKLESQVRFIFSPSDADRDAAYLKSQINILPSKWEAFGIVLIEAMAKGNVIITTNENQAVDILIKSGKSGYSYDFGDTVALSQILKKLLLDYDLRQKIIANNIEFAQSFTWDSIYPKYEKLIKNLLTSKSQ